MPVPMINPLPQAPSRSDGPVAFNALADPFIAALPPFVLQANALALAINNALISIASSVDAAASSASAAATSANAANSSKNAAAQQVGLAADQVALAAGQVALANAAKVDAQSAAVAAGAGAGLPVGREPFTALQINKAGAVGWGPGLPDRAAAQVGQSLMLDGDNLPKWAFAGQQIGDLLTTARNLPIDFSSVQATLPASVNWAAVTYGKGLFVAVATSSNIAATSPDGINWTQRTLPASATWYAVTYGNGLFVAVGGGMTVIATSPDGITWTQRSAPVSATWRSVGYGGGLFVAVGTSSTIAITSPDGITWTQRVLPVSAGWYNVVYGNGVFVVTASSGSVCATSSDGITWTSRTLPASYNLRGVAFGNGLFVAVNNTATAISSPDGITWTVRTLPAPSSWSGITYGNGLFVTVAGGNTIAATSPDGITWTQRALAVSAGWIAVAYGGGIYATIASNSTIAATLVQGSGYLPAGGIYLQSAYPELFAVVGLIGSDAFVSWTALATTTQALSDVDYGISNVWVAVGANGYITRSTDNGVTFTAQTPISGTPNLNAIASDRTGVWVVVGAAGTVYRSTDNGVTWVKLTFPGVTTEVMNGVACDKNGVWLIAGASKVYRSTDNGVTWVALTGLPQIGPYLKIGTDENSTFLLSRDNSSSNLLRSIDRGATFASQTGPSSYRVVGFAYDKTKDIWHAAVQDAGVYQSRNGGANWLVNNSDQSAGNIAQAAYGVAVIDGAIVRVGQNSVPNGTIFRSADDGYSYSAVTSPFATPIRAIASKPDGTSVLVANGTASMARSVKSYNYDTVTQFMLPNLTPVQGMTNYIKAKEVA